MDVVHETGTNLKIYKMQESYVIGDYQVKFPLKPYPVQTAFMRTLLESLASNKQHALLESPTGTGKTLSLLCSLMAWQEQQKRLLGLSPAVIYASRTHSQLSQVVNELKRTEYRPKVAMLSSRQNLCVNPSVRYLPANELRFKCRAMTKARSCLYKENVESYVLEASSKSKAAIGSTNTDSEIIKQNRIMDIEELGTLGTHQNVCPYFLSRSETVQNDADLIFMPYNYLVDPAVREGLEVRWPNAVVVIDEAHNLEQVCDDAASFSISSLEIAGAIRELDVIRNHSIDLDEAAVNLIHHFLIQLEDALMEPALHKNDMDVGREFPGTQIFKMLASAGFDLTNPAPFMDSLTTMIDSGAGPTTQLENIKGLFARLTRSKPNEAMSIADQYYSVYLCEMDTKEQNGKLVKHSGPRPRVLNYWCFSPGVAIAELIQKNIYSLILTSGTLTPLNSFGSQFQLQFPYKLENPHVVEDSQIWIGVIPQGVTNKRLNSNYNNRDSTEYLGEMGNTIANYVRIVPDGMIVFFPSYALMRKSCDFWKNNKTWDRIQACKKIFIEARSASEMAGCVHDYEQEIAKGHGAIFFAVCRGKASEGVNFSDAKARAVIITGLPYPPLKDPRVVLKKKYLARQQAAPLKMADSLSPQEWYSQQAYRAVNQAIGRVIRHRNDYGVILLCDDRFAHESTHQYISLWLRPKIRVVKRFGDSIVQLKQFFKTNQERPDLNQNSIAISSTRPRSSALEKSTALLPSNDYFEKRLASGGIANLLKRHTELGYELDPKRNKSMHTSMLKTFGNDTRSAREDNTRRILEERRVKRLEQEERERAPKLTAIEFIETCKQSFGVDKFKRFKNILKTLKTMQSHGPYTTQIETLQRLLREAKGILENGLKPQLLLANFLHFLPESCRPVYQNLLLE